LGQSLGQTSRTGPHQAQRPAPTGTTISTRLQAFLRLDALRTPCFTRDESPIGAEPPLRGAAPPAAGHVPSACSRKTTRPSSPGRPRGARITARVRGRRPRPSRGRAETPRVSGFEVVNPNTTLGSPTTPYLPEIPATTGRSAQPGKRSLTPPPVLVTSPQAPQRDPLTGLRQPQFSDERWLHSRPTTSDTGLERRGETLALSREG
jgi:hypothetical protein